MKILAIIQLTFRESFAKKTFIAFFGISTLVCLLFIFALNLDVVDGIKSSLSIFGNEAGSLVEVKGLVTGLQSAVAVFLFTGGLFMSLFATSSLIPSFLQPGTIDLILSKPLSRPQILSGRFLGAVAIVTFNVFYLVFFSWLILSLKTNLWNGGFLLAGLMIVLTYVILFSLMTLLGLVTGSGAFSLMITYLILFFSPLLLQRDKIYALLSGKVYGYLLDGLYHFLPKTSELGNMTRLLVQGSPVPSWTPLWTSLSFGIIMFFISTVLFSRKNF
ncbi:MAG: ABC transporter permease subunit [Calditrichaeota bacterium]|nr:ABC transporter permease subunit [Calditrichota bacterium]